MSVLCRGCNRRLAFEGLEYRHMLDGESIEFERSQDSPIGVDDDLGSLEYRFDEYHDSEGFSNAEASWSWDELVQHDNKGENEFEWHADVENDRYEVNANDLEFDEDAEPPSNSNDSQGLIAIEVGNAVSGHQTHANEAEVDELIRYEDGVLQRPDNSASSFDLVSKSSLELDESVTRAATDQDAKGASSISASQAAAVFPPEPTSQLSTLDHVPAATSERNVDANKKSLVKIPVLRSLDDPLGSPTPATPKSIDVLSLPKSVNQVVQNLRSVAETLFTSPLAVDLDTVDTAIRELFDDLEVLRRGASSMVLDSPVVALIVSVVAGAIVSEVIRPRRRAPEALTIDVLAALWMYPECSGLAKKELK